MNHSDCIRHWIIRNACGSDLAFLYATWSNSYHHDSLLAKSCKASVFGPYYDRVIDHILIQPDTRVRIACNPSDPNVIWGYLVSQPKILHYTFVKEAFRKLKIGTDLFQDMGECLYFTHRTQFIEPILRKYSKITYNPFLLFRGEHNGKIIENTSKDNSSLRRT